MAPLPVEVLFGIYLGVLTGIIPALVAGVLGFVFKYLTSVTLPGFGVVVLGLAIAGINGGLLALNDPTLRQNASGTVVIVAIVVVLMLTFYAHAKGDELGATFPHRVSLRRIRERTLSSDVVELVGNRGEVRVEVTGEVEDIEGYPPVPEAIRTGIRERDWRLPADLPLSELESRLAERLRTEFDLTEVTVEIDERGRATVAAAPPLSGLSKRVPSGRRAVSVQTLLPSGLARGDEVTVVTLDRRVEGTVLSVRSGGGSKATDGGRPLTDGGATDGAEPAATAPVTRAAVGGDGRLTVAVTRADAPALLRADRPRIVVGSRGIRREFELLSLLRRAGRRFRRVTVRSGGPLDGATIGSADVRATYGVVLLAIRHPEGWTVAPRGTESLAGGDEVFAVGTREQL
ncbi:MAG: TrkA C-terminal domain-containing protein, partial [Haloarculaceae archaeon]